MIAMYSRSRLDALGDGIFAVAMTLLVLDVQLPNDFHPETSVELLRGVWGLYPKLFPYALSFFVLGRRWLLEAQDRGERLHTHGYAQGWLALLFLVTLTPFTTILVGRYSHVASAVWLYVGNIVLLSAMSLALAGGAPQTAGDRRQRMAGFIVLLLSGAAAVVMTFFAPDQAMWALLLNFLAPIVVRWFGWRDADGG